jgi:hypothetical protein
MTRLSVRCFYHQQHVAYQRVFGLENWGPCVSGRPGGIPRFENFSSASSSVLVQCSDALRHSRFERFLDVFLRGQFELLIMQIDVLIWI